MLLRELINKNKKASVNIPRLMELKKYYMYKYRFYLLKLYTEGYISDPTIFIDSEIYANILDMGITDMLDVIGKVVLTSEVVEFAMVKATPEQKHFLGILKEVLKYREYSSDLDLFYETFSSSINLKLTYNGGHISSKLGVPLTRGNLMYFVSPEETLYTVNIRPELWDLCMAELGIPEKDWHKDGLFISGFTHQEELRFMKLILDGKFILTGSHSSILNEWLLKNKWGIGSLKLLTRGLLGHIYYSRSSDILTIIENRLNTLNTDDVVTVIGDSFYLKKPIKNYYIPVGFFSILSGINGYEDKLYDDIPFQGYTGEAYPLSYLTEEDLTYIGVPLEVGTSEGSYIIYDREQVNLLSDTLFNCAGFDFSFESPTAFLPNPYKEGTVENLIYSTYIDAQKGILTPISMSIGFNNIKKALNKLK